MLSIIVSRFTGAIILVGNTNINVNEATRLQTQYQKIIENFNLVQRINFPIRKGTHWPHYYKHSKQNIVF